MTHSERIFGTTLETLVYTDIETFFNTSRQENDLLEFKSFNRSQTIEQNIHIIHKGVSAFLNSEGGLIIWGAPIGSLPSGGTEKIFQGSLIPLTSVPGHDQMVNKISDKLIPLPNSIKVNVIPNSGNTESICVIEIEKSQYAPHQTGNTYYMRMDGQSRPAPHHYIEALFKQIRFPEIRSYIKFTNVTVGQNALVLHTELMIFNFSELQNEEQITYQLTCSEGLFEEYFISSADPDFRMNGHQIIRTLPRVLSFGSPFRVAHSFVLTTGDLSASSGIINLTLIVNGKSSPSRMNNYRVQLTNQGTMNTRQINQALQHVSENKLMSEHSAQLGLNRETQLTTVLQRRPSDLS